MIESDLPGAILSDLAVLLQQTLKSGHFFRWGLSEEVNAVIKCVESECKNGKYTSVRATVNKRFDVTGRPDQYQSEFVNSRKF